ncbi:hypothetical protein NDU88_007755 [Pleurodeles waltl]|uniref:Uncharacterized protein n=1 Tax=Pleurodeles waltl TaxID=8319 RepID=A0AAV7QPW5_PLEWA|nr:hypothetical protein NDU88_007755 [Pleurodeles waltl]
MEHVAKPDPQQEEETADPDDREDEEAEDEDNRTSGQQNLSHPSVLPMTHRQDSATSQFYDYWCILCGSGMMA